MSQVVLPPNVGDLLRLHGLQLRTVGNTMTKTTTERAAPLPCERTRMSDVKQMQKAVEGWERTFNSQQRVCCTCEEHSGPEKRRRCGQDLV